MKVRDLGYPEEFIEIAGGDHELYPHQQEAIEAIRAGRNVLVTVPTASGKTLIAYAAIMERQKMGLKSLYIVPLKSLASEKFDDLKKLRKLGIRVTIAVGDVDSSPSFINNYDVIVCTSEKADSMIRHDPSILYDIGLIIADEAHLIGDTDRGPKLEMVLSACMYLNPDITIISLSATISNGEEMAKWLKSDLVKSDYRPVPLKYGIINGNEIEYTDGETEKVSAKNYLEDIISRDIEGGGQVLIFVNSRSRAENLARQLLSVTGKYVFLEEGLIDLGEDADKYQEMLKSLMRRGVSFHHAGLSMKEKESIERLFRDRYIRVLVATPTLAAGVNLPARTVVVRDMSRFMDGYSQYVKKIEILQMLGRAGRPKYDREGRALLYASTDNAVEKAHEYLSGESEPIISIFGQKRALQINVLALVSTGIATNLEEVKKFFGSTFFGQQNVISDIYADLEKTMGFLISEGFVRERVGSYEATTFGKTVSDLYIEPKTAIILREYFDKPHSIDLALFYICKTPDMINFSTRTGDMPYIAEFLEKIEILEDDEDNYAAAKTAIVLGNWIEEVPIIDITEKFNIGPGDVQSKIASADWISYSLSRLAEMFKPEIRNELEKLNIRIKEGIKEDVLSLITIPNIGRVRARRLHRSGYRTLDELASADPTDISRIFGFSSKLASETVSHAKRLKGRMK
ncbi:Putative ski2-type helicase [Thermoplasmatales archaeon]|nr:Putative ski2-type helicase [Thermoplasmatales archaeon]